MPPKNLTEVKADAKVWAAYLAFTKRNFTQNEALFYFDNGNAQGVYAKYIDPKSAKQANLTGRVTNPAKELADADDFNNPKWKAIIKAGKDEVADNLIDALKNDFPRSPEYKKAVMGDPKKAAKILGITDVKKLTKAMEEVVAGDKREAEKLLAELVKSEELTQKAADMLRALEKAGLV
jgi:hypothetical protein